MNMTSSQRVEFLELFSQVSNSSHYPDIYQILQSQPYCQFEENYHRDVLAQIYNMICNNEVEQLDSLLSNYQIGGIANLQFDIFEEDEEVLSLADDQKITTAFLNPILLAVKSKSFACLKYLVERFGVRRSMRSLDVNFKHDKHGEFPFKNILLPILLKQKDVDALSFLSHKTRDFVLTAQDLQSFVSLSLAENWTIGLKTFLLSETAHFYFNQLGFDEQRLLIERVIKSIEDVEDAHHKRALQRDVIAECLSRRPYSKHLFVALAEGLTKSQGDQAKLARDCLKSLTSEDLMLMAQFDHQQMADFERKYSSVDISSENGNSLEVELARIVTRYAKEGRPDSLAPQFVESRKQVRFEENSQLGDNRI